MTPSEKPSAANECAVHLPGECFAGCPVAEPSAALPERLVVSFPDDWVDDGNGKYRFRVMTGMGGEINTALVAELVRRYNAYDSLVKETSIGARAARIENDRLREVNADLLKACESAKSFLNQSVPPFHRETIDETLRAAISAARSTNQKGG